MPRAKPDPEIVDQARELRRVGCSFREIGDTLGVTAPTVKRWLDEPEAAATAQPPSVPTLPAPSLPAHMHTPEAPPLVPVNTDDPIALVKQLIREQHAQIHMDRAAGGRGTSISSAVATLEKLTKTLKQLEEADRKAGDGITISGSDVARIRDSLEARVTAICNRPLLCANCSRALSVHYGTGGKPPPPVAGA
jgi:predicted transcriptional regulator